MKKNRWILSTIRVLCFSISLTVLGTCNLNQESSYSFMATGHGSAIMVECGWWLYADGPGTSLDPLNPAGGAAHHKILVSDTYQGADWWKYEISAVDAIAGGPCIYIKVTSSQTGGYETKIVDEEGNKVDTMEYYSPGPESDATIGPMGPGSANGGGSPYATVICTELHRQGLMDEATFKADQAFGRYLKKNHNDVLIGYHFWAKPVVSLMKRSRAFTQIVNVLAQPWSYEMAFRMGAREKGSFVGELLLDVGVLACRTIGRVLVWAGNTRIAS